MFVVTIMSLTIFGSWYPQCRSVIVAPILFSTCGGRKRFHNAAAPPYQNWNTPSSRIPRILGFTNKSICSFNTNNIFSFSPMAGRCSFFGHDDSSSNTMTVIMFGWRWWCSTIRRFSNEDGWQRFGIQSDGWRCSTMFDGRRCSANDDVDVHWRRWRKGESNCAVRLRLLQLATDRGAQVLLVTSPLHDVDDNDGWWWLTMEKRCE